MNGKIWVLGDAVVDLPDGEGRLLQCPGGAPATWRSAWRGSAVTAGLSAASATILRPFYASHRRSEQVDVNCASMRRAHLHGGGRSDSHGERLPLWSARAPTCSFSPRSPAAGRWLHVCSIALSAEPSRSTTFAAMEAIKRAGAVFDPNIRSDLWQDPQDLRDCLDRALALADAIKLSEEELAFISGSDDIVSGIARLNARFQPTLLLVTRVKRGPGRPARG